MRNLIIYIFILLSSVLTAQNSFKKGEQLFKNEQWLEARSKFQEVESSSANYAKSQEYLGDIAAHQKEWNEALDYYEYLVEKYPESANYNFKYGGALGMKALTLSKMQAAFYISDIKYYLKQAAQLDSNHIEVRWALVELYMELPGILGGSSETASQYARQLQEISEVDGWLAKGFIARKEKDFSLAEKYFKNALRVGGSVTCYEKLLELYLENTKEHHKAKNLLKEAKKAHPRANWTSFVSKFS